MLKEIFVLLLKEREEKEFSNFRFQDIVLNAFDPWLIRSYWNTKETLHEKEMLQKYLSLLFNTIFFNTVKLGSFWDWFKSETPRLYNCAYEERGGVIFFTLKYVVSPLCCKYNIISSWGPLLWWIKIIYKSWGLIINFVLNMF